VRGDGEKAGAGCWGYGSRRRRGSVSPLNFYEPIVGALMGHRLIHDFMVVVVAHGLFARHPELRFASIENGVSWVRDAQKTLARLGTDLVEQFHQHVWVTPFTDDD